MLPRQLNTVCLALLIAASLTACQDVKQTESTAAPSAAAPASAPDAAPPRLAPGELGTTPNVHTYGRVILSGQPSALDLKRAKDRGVTTVVDLRTAAENRGFDEPQAAADAGLTYVNVPFRGPDTLSDDVFDNVRAQLKSAEGGIIVHCGSANRVGPVWLAHRVLDGGLTYEQALAEAKQIGMRTDGYAERAKQYIESKQ